MTWRIAVATGRLLPVYPHQPSLERIDVPDDEIDQRRAEEEARIAAENTVVDPDAPAHLIAIPNEGMMAGQPTNSLLLGYVAEGPLTLIDCGSPGTFDIFTNAFDALGVDRLFDPARVMMVTDHDVVYLNDRAVARGAFNRKAARAWGRRPRAACPRRGGHGRPPRST